MEELQTDFREQTIPVQVHASDGKPAGTLTDRILAVFLLALGYLLCRFQIHEHPLLGLVYGLALFILTMWYFRGRVGKRSFAMLALGVVFLLSHLFTDNGPVRFCARWLSLLLWGYAAYCAGGNSAEERMGDMLVPETLKANFLMPFARLGAFFNAGIFAGRRNWPKMILFILLGLGLALLPLLLIVDLLQYDSAFSKLLDGIFSEELPEAVFRRLFYLVLAAAVAALLMSTMTGSREHRMSSVLSREKWNAFSIRRRFLNPAVSATMLIPLLLVYGLFFFSQLPLYTSAFSGVLPEGYTFADYAREGFFQLCAVCVINGILYLFASLFTRMDRGASFQRTLLTLLCVCSLALAITAFSKMILYIRTYGLTPNRVYASWAMILLTAAFIVALVGAYWKKLNISRALFVLCAVMFGFLCICDTNAMIAEYNVRAYERGSLDSVDTGIFWELGDSAAPAAARLAEDPAYGGEVKRFLKSHGEKTVLSAFFHGIPGLKARAACQDYWRKETAVIVQIDTETSFASLECWYGEKGYEHCAGSAMHADATPFIRGQGASFELDPVEWDGWDAIEQGDDVHFQLAVTDTENREWLTNILDGGYGEIFRVTLTGSNETGYIITSAG